MLEIWDPWEDNVLHTSDGFIISNSDIAVEKIAINQAQWETWDANVLIDDSVFNVLEPATLDNGCVLKIAFAREANNLQNAFYGIIDNVGPFRTKESRLTYTVDAKGFGVINNYTYVDFQKVPPPETLKENAVASNPAIVPFYAKNLFKDLFEGLDIMPMLDYTLSQRFGKNFDIEGISDIVKDFIPGIKAPLVTAAQVANIIARMSGAIWYVDHNKKLQFRYPYGDNSGHIIKDYPTIGDQGDWTAYVREKTQFGYQDSTRPEDGFANQLLAIAEKIDLIGVQAKAVSFQNLYNKDLAFAVYPGAPKFKNMTFIMSKIGAGTNHPNPEVAKLYGFIISDRNFSPTGELIATFSINVKDIPEVPSPIVKIDRPKFDDIDPDKLYWIVLQEIGSAENNTIRVWHDDDRETPSTDARPRYSAVRLLPRGRSDGDPFSREKWYVSNHGPEYSISFATTSNIICEASDPNSIERWTPNRPVQSRVSVPTLKSAAATQQYLDLVVSLTAQKIRNYGTVEVTIPNVLIQSGTELQVASDLIPGLEFESNVMAEVKRVAYELDVYNFAVGSKHCYVDLLGYVTAL